MKSDSEIQYEVEGALRRNPEVAHVGVGVTVCEGVVTLSGHVPTFQGKCAAEKSAYEVDGVKAVAEKLEVRLASDLYDHDEQLGRAAHEALTQNPQVPADVHVKVERGWITLSGQVHSQPQREAAASTVLAVNGIVGVFNQITFAPIAEEIGAANSEGDSSWKRNQSNGY